MLHGTGGNAIAGILEENFDPNRRCAQLYGPGFYASKSLAIAADYYGMVRKDSPQGAFKAIGVKVFYDEESKEINSEDDPIEENGIHIVPKALYNKDYYVIPSKHQCLPLFGVIFEKRDWFPNMLFGNDDKFKFFEGYVNIFNSKPLTH